MINSLKHNIFLYLAVALIFHAPRFGNIDLSAIIAFLLGSSYFALLLKEKKKLIWLEYFFLYFILYALGLYALEGLSNFAQNGSYFFRLTRSGLVYFSFFLFCRWWEIKPKDLVNPIIFALSLNMLVILLQYFTRGTLQDYLIALNTLFPSKQNMDEHEMIKMGVRVRGLMKGFDGAGILVAFLCHMVLFYKKNIWLKIGIIALGFLGVMITSRTGFVAYIVVVGCYMLVSLFSQSLKKALVHLGAIVSLFVIGITIVVTFFQDTSFYKLSFKKAFEIYYVYRDTGVLETESSTLTYVDHFTLRNLDSKKIFWVGQASKQHAIDVNKPEAYNKLTSDVGYIQILHNFGVINLVIFLSFLGYFIYRLFREKIPEAIPITVSILTVLVVCLKGPYFFSRGVFDIVIFGFFIYSYHARFPQSRSA